MINFSVGILPNDLNNFRILILDLKTKFKISSIKEVGEGDYYYTDFVAQKELYQYLSNLPIIKSLEHFME
jgi:hypothetical protein